MLQTRKIAEVAVGSLDRNNLVLFSCVVEALKTASNDQYIKERLRSAFSGII